MKLIRSIHVRKKFNPPTGRLMRFWYQLKCCAAPPTLKFMFPQLGLLITVFERWSMGSNKRAGSWNFNSRPRYGFQDRLPSIHARRTCKVALTTLSLVTDNCRARPFDDFRFSLASRFRLSASAEPTLLGQQKATQKKFRKTRERHRFQCPPKITARLFAAA